ncbi:pectate lyase-like adhesive domain-containing protein [Methanobrevibacter sp.]|uniref:pectate lyase-like adhesive domain-containing protein n=1 Tax=Methanobrevibacter sp. TaxID=66852 RepID=UPI00386EE0AC
MKRKGILFILLLSCMLFSISSVMASDANDTAISIEENTAVATDMDDALIESASNDVVGDADDGTFTALQNKINNASKGDTIILDKDYAYDEGFSTRGIEIKKDLTIDGNGHTLDGLSKSRILIVKFGAVSNNKVTLKNIKFTNGNTKLYGGAIFNYANLTVNNCSFANNHADCCGGAINSVGHLIANKCTFKKNTADGDAGAVFTLSIDKSVDYFTNYYKNATPDGNMEFVFELTVDVTLKYGTDYLKNCVFNNNVAKGRGGGAVYAFTHININSCTFNSNKAGEHGGAVFGNKNLFISNSKFTNNKAPMYGGAVYFRCHEQSGHYENGKWVSEIKYYSNSIKSSTFTKNTASKGGAIYGFRYSDSDKTHCAKAVKCKFTDNKASKGRDIYGGTTSKCVFNYLKLTLKKVTVKKSAKKLVLTATLKKGSTPIKSKKITFKFNGKTYKVKTNKKGIAKLTIKKSILKKLKVGKKITYKVIYGKLTVKRTAKVKK